MEKSPLPSQNSNPKKIISFSANLHHILGLYYSQTSLPLPSIPFSQVLPNNPRPNWIMVFGTESKKSSREKAAFVKNWILNIFILIIRKIVSRFGEDCNFYNCEYVGNIQRYVKYGAVFALFCCILYLSFGIKLMKKGLRLYQNLSSWGSILLRLP